MKPTRKHAMVYGIRLAAAIWLVALLLWYALAAITYGYGNSNTAFWLVASLSVVAVSLFNLATNRLFKCPHCGHRVEPQLMAQAVEHSRWCTYCGRPLT